MPPTVTIIGPTPGVAPGTPGGFSADWATARETPIVVEITDAIYELISVQYPGVGDETVVYRDGAFRGSYAARSTEAAITGGKRFSILPVSGWPSSDALNDVTFNVDPVEGAAAPTYTVDATSGLPIPQTLAEFEAMMFEVGELGGPTHGYLIGQALSAPIADLGGLKNLADISSGGPAGVAYNVVHAGWSSRFLRFAVGVSGLFGNNTFANVNANPYLMIVRASIDAIGGQAGSIFHIGTIFDDDAAVELSTTPRITIGEGFGAVRNAGTINPITAADVITFALYIDPGPRRACMVYTSLEKIDSRYGGIYAAGTTLALGGDFTQTWYPPTMDVLDAWVFTGVNAQKAMPSIRAIMAKLDGVALAAYPKFSWNMIKTAAGATYDAGARTSQAFAGDVYVETKLGNTGDTWAIGLGADDPDQDYASMDYAVLNDSGAMYAYANGVGTNLGIAPAIGEVWRVAREGSAVKIYKDGVVVHTFAAASAGAIHVDSAIRIQGSTIRNIRVVAAGVEQDVTWTNVVNAAVY